MVHQRYLALTFHIVLINTYGKTKPLKQVTKKNIALILTSDGFDKA